MSHTVNAVLEVLAGAVAGLDLPGLGEVVAAYQGGAQAVLAVCLVGRKCKPVAVAAGAMEVQS